MNINPSSSFRSGRARKFKSDINVVPYIDVMMVLLVIFMVAAPLTNPSVINLPTAARSTAPPTQYIDIALKPNSGASLRLQGSKGAEPAPHIITTRSNDELTQQLTLLHQTHPTLPVMISADKDIAYDKVIKVITLAKTLGVDRVGLATK